MSDDLISREETLYELATSAVYYFGIEEDKAAHDWAMGVVSKMPSAEPEPSELARDIATIIENEMDMRVVLKNAQPERKKGKWTSENACEFCGFQPWYERDIHTLSYCPNCGADMREREGE